MFFANVVFALVAGLGAYLFVTGIVNALSRKQKVVAALDESQPEAEIVLSDSVFGLGKPLGQPAARLGQRIFRDDPETVESKLRRSGWRYKSVLDFYGSKILNAVVLFVVVVIAGVIMRFPLPFLVLTAAAGGVFGLFNADIEVERAIQARRKALFREMAWTLDRLAIMMESGSALTTGVKDLLDISKGRGGLFMAVLRQIANDLKGGSRNPRQIVEYVRGVMPELPELDTFLQLMRLNLDEGQPIALQLRTLARAMRDELTNQIERRRQSAEMRIVIITSAVVVPVLLVIVGGPTLLTLMRVLR